MFRDSYLDEYIIFFLPPAAMVPKVSRAFFFLICKRSIDARLTKSMRMVN